MLTSIAGRSVIVTGASKGIGKGIARVFAGKGARVLVVARDQAAPGEEVAPFPDARRPLALALAPGGFRVRRGSRACHDRPSLSGVDAVTSTTAFLRHCREDRSREQGVPVGA